MLHGRYELCSVNGVTLDEMVRCTSCPMTACL